MLPVSEDQLDDHQEGVDLRAEDDGRRRVEQTIEFALPQILYKEQVRKQIHPRELASKQLHVVEPVQLQILLILFTFPFRQELHQRNQHQILAYPRDQGIPCIPIVR